MSINNTFSQDHTKPSSFTIEEENLAHLHELFASLPSDNIHMLPGPSRGIEDSTQTLFMYSSLDGIPPTPDGNQGDQELMSQLLQADADPLINLSDQDLIGANWALETAGDTIEATNIINPINQASPRDTLASLNYGGVAFDLHGMGASDDPIVVNGLIRLEAGETLNRDGQTNAAGRSHGNAQQMGSQTSTLNMNTGDSAPLTVSQQAVAPPEPLSAKVSQPEPKQASLDNSRYELGTAGLTWEEAQAEAQTKGGKIVEINSAAENEFIFETFGGDANPIWLGFNDKANEGTFTDSDGNDIAYQNWLPGQPDDFLGQDYAVMASSSGQWDDSTHLESYFFDGQWLKDTTNQLVIEFEQAEPQPPIIDGVEIGDSHFYLDFNDGDDSSSGNSRANAWRSFERVNQAVSSGEISTGTDLIIYGNSKDQQAIIDWNGTPDDPVLIVTDTSSDRATLVADANTASSIFHITGSNIEVHNVVVEGEPTGYSEPIDYFEFGLGPDQNQAATGYIRGFALEDANNVVLDGVEASGTYSGVYIDSKSEFNKVINSYIHHNNIITIHPGDDDDAGGIAVLIQGNNNEIAHNRFEYNIAGSVDYVMDGAAIELFNGSNNSIHHNSSHQDRVFAELGRAASSQQKMIGNSFTFNTASSNYNNIAETNDGIWTEYRRGGRFIITRGEGNFGPVYDTTVTDNIVTMDGGGSDFIVCMQCGEDILTYGRNTVQTTRHRVWWDGAEPRQVN